MQGLVGLLCFSLLLATGTCLECESCSGFKADCTGQLQLCNGDQDTCATIRTETIMGKVSSFTIVKSCYHSSKCLRSSRGNSLIKVNVNIECSLSPAGKMESEDGKAPVFLSNELPDNQLQVEGFRRPKSRAAEALNSNPLAIDPTSGDAITVADPPTRDINPSTVEIETTTAKLITTTGKPATTTLTPTTTAKPDPNTAKPDTTTAKPDPNTAKPDPNTAKPDPNTAKPDTTTAKPDTTTAKPDPNTAKPDPNTAKPDPNTAKPDTTTVKPNTEPPKLDTTTAKPITTTAKPTKTTKAPTEKPKTNKPSNVQTTTVGSAHQTVASFLLALSSLLLMNILL